MKGLFRWALYIALFVYVFLISTDGLYAEPLKFSSSTQLLFGDDLFGESQTIVAQYLRFSYNPEDKKFSAAGYGRVWKDFTGGKIRDDDVLGRLYYLFLEYAPMDKLSMRLGRQFMAFTSGNSIMDGLRIDAHDFSPVGVTLAAGRDVVFSLDSEHSRNGNYFFGVDVHLDKIKSTQLGVSYVRKYNRSDLAREEFGVNFRYIYKYASPYAEARYDALSKAVDEATVGIDLFPIRNLMIKGEFYHSYPTFDSTTIYSVFAVDKYREYLVRAEYSLDSPVTLYTSYAKQTYEDSENADRFTVGAEVSPLDKLTVRAGVDYRHGYNGNIWGFEVIGNYRLLGKLLLSAGVQYDAYRRPDEFGNNYAKRYWLGGLWSIGKDTSLSARIEDNVNENFDHRPSARIAFSWTL
ncbi:MAG TPA: porin [Thermodesulfovibrionales bacterium]|nr:porin [Thermodesulfovibrionales bacterium]